MLIRNREAFRGFEELFPAGKDNKKVFNEWRKMRGL